jgi:hypothetical protein
VLLPERHCSERRRWRLTDLCFEAGECLGLLSAVNLCGSESLAGIAGHQEILSVVLMTHPAHCFSIGLC